MARPTSYRVEFCQQAHKLAQEGATDKEIADALEISDRQLYRWANQYPEFRQSLTLGKEAADARVERSLYHRAVGYTFESIKIFQYEGKPVVVPYTEHVPPDIGAAKSWLCNRKPADWREKVEHEVDGNLSIELVSFVDASQAPSK